MRIAPTESSLAAACAAAVLPLVVYVLTASGHGYWLDSGELAAAAIWLDIAHPPGHPLASLWGRLFCLLPAGPLPFRVAVGQAVAGALALACLQRAFERSLAHVGLPTGLARSLLSVAGCWLLGSAYGFWFQAVRAEVYALEALLVCLALERLSLLACSAAPPDPRPLYVACIALGLGLANHHFVAVLAMPVLAAAVVQLTRAHGARVLGHGLSAGALGLSTYVYLPLRAAREPPMDLGHPVGLVDLLWVVSARVYARHIGADAPQPLGERMLDLLVLLSENLGIAVMLTAALGAYALLRAKRSLPLSLLWTGTALLSLCGRAWLNAVRANPDVLGYMIPGFAAVVALALVGLAAICVSVPARLREAATWTAVLAVGALLIARFPVQHARATLRDFRATDVFDAGRRRGLPTGALLVLTTPDAAFRHWEGEASDGLRHDVQMLALPFVGYGSVHEVWRRRHPALSPVIDAYLAEGALRPEPLRQLAAIGPTYVELDLSTSLALYPHALPDRLWYRVLPAPPTHAAVTAACAARRSAREALVAQLATDAHEVETRKQLLLLHYVDALYATSHGLLHEARLATHAGLALAPDTRELRALERMLREAHPPSFEHVLAALGHLPQRASN